MLTVNNKVAVVPFRKGTEIKVSAKSGLAVIEQKVHLQEVRTVYPFKTQSGTVILAGTRAWIPGEAAKAELPVQTIDGVEFVIIEESQLRIIDV